MCPAVLDARYYYLYLTYVHMPETYYKTDKLIALQYNQVDISAHAITSIAWDTCHGYPPCILSHRLNWLLIHSVYPYSGARR